MYLKCAHPDCTADFDYGQGRFFRFQQTLRQDTLPANSHNVKHYWLCTRCCEMFTIDYQKGTGVILRQKLETLTVGQPFHFVLQDENGVDQRLPRRINRKRFRERKRKAELVPGQTNTIEILENRNLERRS